MHSEALSYAKMALCKLKGALSFTFVQSGWHMHSEALSYAKMALCKLKGALSFTFVQSGWHMHSEALSYAKMALCKLKGALSFTFVKSGGTCTFCHLVPTSCVSFQLALRSSLVLLLFVLFLALCKKSDVTVRKS